MEALLTPIPAIHIEEGEAVFAEYGRVAFGSDAWELFDRLRQEGADKGLPVLIYASATGSQSRSSPFALHKVVCSAMLDGFEEGHGGRHKRPHLRTKTALATDSSFVLFWEVVALKRLEPPINLNSLRPLQAKGKTGKVLTEAPRGPIRVWLDENPAPKNIT